MRICRSIIAILLTIGASSIAAFAADPATRPAPSTQPATVAKKEPIPKDWVKETNATYHFELSFPKKWEKNVTNQNQVAYLVFGPGAAKAPGLQAGPGPAGEPCIFVAVAGKCHRTTVEGYADEVRKAMPTDSPKGKILTDQAATIGDRAAWLFVTEAPVASGMIVVPGHPEQNHEVVKKHKTYRLVTVDGDVLYDVSFTGEASAYTAALANAKKVIGTFTWTAPPTEADPAK
jgi:hypothetical protein